MASAREHCDELPEEVEGEVDTALDTPEAGLELVVRISFPADESAGEDIQSVA